MPGTPYKVPAHRVYLRPTWGALWTEIPGLWCAWCRWTCAPEISRAELAWRYGRVMLPGNATFADYGSDDLIGHYCKVEIDQRDDQGQPADPIRWYGVVTEVGDNLGGGATGAQAIVCHGLELLLDRVYLDRSWYQSGSVNVVDIEVPRAIDFNAQHDFLDDTKTRAEEKGERFGNRSPWLGQRSYVFAGDLKTAVFWRTCDILNYLVAYHSPKSTSGQEVIKWEITDRALALIPDWDRPIVHAQGKTVKKVLDELFDRRRLFSWRVVVELAGGVERPKLDIFSFNHAAIAMPGGGTQPANPDVQALSFGDQVEVAGATLQTSDVQRVDRVIVRGARKRAMFTVSKADSTLEADWKADDETTYESGPTGIGSLAPLQKRMRVRNWRREDRFKRVFAYFRVPRDWNYFVGDGIGGEPQKFFPDDPETGAERIFLPEARFSRSVFRGTITTAPDGSAEDDPQPAAWIVQYTEGTTSRWQHVEKLHTQETALMPDLAMIDFNCGLQMQTAGLGVIVRVHGSQHWDQEAIAKTDFAKLSGVDVYDPLLDWRDMVFTVCLELDSRVQAAYPGKADFEALGLESARILEIDLGDRYRLDYVAPSTVKGVQDGELQRFGTGGTWFRDDRPALADLARLVYDWYATSRRALHLARRRLKVDADVGTIISTIDREGEQIDVWTPVTSVHLDLQACTTTIATAFGDLDPLRL